MKRFFVTIMAFLLFISGCQTLPKTSTTTIEMQESLEELESEKTPAPTLEPTIEIIPDPTIEPKQIEKTSLEKFKDALNNDDYDSEYHRLKKEVEIIKSGLESNATNGVKYRSACNRMFGDDAIEHEEVARRVKSWGNLFDEDSQTKEIVVFISGFGDKYMTRNKDEGTIDINVTSLVDFAKDSNMSELNSLYLLYALNMFGEMNFSELEISDPEALQLILAICEELNQIYDMSGYIGQVE